MKIRNWTQLKDIEVAELFWAIGIDAKEVLENVILIPEDLFFEDMPHTTDAFFTPAMFIGDGADFIYYAPNREQVETALKKTPEWARDRHGKVKSGLPYSMYAVSAAFPTEAKKLTHTSWLVGSQVEVATSTGEKYTLSKNSVWKGGASE